MFRLVRLACNVLPFTRGKVAVPLLAGDRAGSELFEKTRLTIISIPGSDKNYLDERLNQMPHLLMVFFNQPRIYRGFEDLMGYTVLRWADSRKPTVSSQGHPPIASAEQLPVSASPLIP